ncbi:hypothetical protein AB1K56_01290 [Microbacterium sp. BWR-S6Y]|uniref:hypothetical protein n=1 Tax=Microbacterium sp. BWR-S6Y TaxID=3232073 RepID=UPI0035272E5E
MTNRDELVARLLIEERWAHLHARGNRDEASDLSALPIERGGLGRRLHPATLKARIRSYDAKRAQRLEEQRNQERERRVHKAVLAAIRADKRVASLAGSSDPDAYSAALRAYERAEELVDKRRVEHVPLTRWMRDSDELDVSLELREAVLGIERAGDARGLATLLRLREIRRRRVARSPHGPSAG